jgi:large conductance mechanosensitive channel
MSILKEFKDFAVKGNMIDLAVGVIIGGAFGKIVSSLVSDIIMPVISLIVGKVDFTNLFISLDGNKYATLQAAQEAGAATLNYGLFLTNIIDFLIIGFSIFIIIKQINKLQPKKVEEPAAEEPTTKTCPYCQSTISIKAVKCPHCTSDLK